MIGHEPPHNRHQHGRRHDRRHFMAPVHTHPADHPHAPAAKPPSVSATPHQLTADELNDLSQQGAFSDDKSEQAYFASQGQTTRQIATQTPLPAAAPPERPAQYTPPSGQPLSVGTLRVQAAKETPAVETGISGRAEYTFQVGDGHVPYLYSATLQADGSLKGQAYQVEGNQRVPAELPTSETNELDKYARMDIARAHQQNPGQVANIRADLTASRIEHVSEAMATSMLALATIKKGKEGAVQVLDYMNQHPDDALSLLHGHRQRVEEMVATNPYLVTDAIRPYRAAHPGTALSNELGAFDKGNRSETALNVPPSFARPTTNPTF